MKTYTHNLLSAAVVAAITAEIEDVVTKLQQTHRLKFFDLWVFGISG